MPEYNYSEYTVYPRLYVYDSGKRIEGEDPDYWKKEAETGGLFLESVEKQNNFARLFMMGQGRVNGMDSPGFSFDEMCLTGKKYDEERRLMLTFSRATIAHMASGRKENLPKNFPEHWKEYVENFANVLVKGGQQLLQTELPDVDFLNQKQMRKHRERLELLRSQLKDYNSYIDPLSSLKNELETARPELKDLYEPIRKSAEFLDMLCELAGEKDLAPEKLEEFRQVFSERETELKGKSLQSVLADDKFSEIDRKREEKVNRDRLEEFYDRLDAFDFDALDLSYMMDPEQDFSEDMKKKNRDRMNELQVLQDNYWTISRIEKEYPDYLEKRYPSSNKEAKMRCELIQNFLKSADELSVQISLQEYRQNMAALLGKESDPNLRFRIAIDTWLGTELRDYVIGESEDENEFKDALFDSTLGTVFKMDVTKRHMEESGLSFEDMIFIDGQSLRERYGAACEGMSEEEREQRLKHEAVQDMISGNHRVELATMQMDSKGGYSIHVAAVQPDLHMLDHFEKHWNHNSMRRAFDFGLTKIETRADRSDKLWAKDPERETRQNGIRNAVVGRINERINEKELNKELKKSGGQIKRLVRYSDLAKEVAAEQKRETGKKRQEKKKENVKKNAEPNREAKPKEKEKTAK